MIYIHCFCITVADYPTRISGLQSITDSRLFIIRHASIKKNALNNTDVIDIIGFIKNKNDLFEKIYVHFFKFNITYVYSLFLLYKR